MGNRILADSVKGLDHIGTFDDMMQERFANIDLSCLMPFMIDTVPAPALPFLAELFNVLGYKGWLFATTEAQQRALIKKGIELNRRAGTPWAIKNALNSLGYTNIVIQESVYLRYNNIAEYDGTYTYSGSPFNFRIVVDFSIFPTGFTANDLYLIEQVTLAWKNARSHLIDVSIGVYENDITTSADTLTINVDHPSNHSLDYSLSL